MVRSFLKAITDRFDWFFRTNVDYNAFVRLCTSRVVWLAFWAYLSMYGHF